jgi:hypothetical protein
MLVLVEGLHVTKSVQAEYTSGSEELEQPNIKAYEQVALPRLERGL